MPHRDHGFQQCCGRFAGNTANIFAEVSLQLYKSIMAFGANDFVAPYLRYHSHLRRWTALIVVHRPKTPQPEDNYALPVCGVFLLSVPRTCPASVFPWLAPLCSALSRAMKCRGYFTSSDLTVNKCAPLQILNILQYHKSLITGQLGPPLSGVIILTVSGGCQSQEMGLFPLNPPLRG